MRNFLVFSALVAGVFTLSIQHLNDINIDPYAFEEQINETIESIRPLIPDPLTIDTLPIDLPDSDDAIITGNASVSNLQLSGLKGFQVTALDLALIGVELNITVRFPVLELFTDYSLGLEVVEELYLYGDGNFSLKLEDVQIEGSGHLNLTGTPQIENLRVQLHLGNATFGVNGLFNDEDASALLTSILNDLVLRLINEFPEETSQVASPIFETIVNAIIREILTPTTPPTETTQSLIDN